MVKVISIPFGTALKGKNLLPLGAKQILPLREVSIFIRVAIEENHCLIL